MYCRAIVNLMQRHNFIESANSINNHFSDTGLFGLSLNGPGQDAKSLALVALEEMHKLRIKITDEELNRAKNILKINILMAMERREDRLEEIARNYMTYGGFTFNDYCKRIDEVTSESVNRAASKTLSKNPTFLVTAPNIDSVPSLADIKRYFN